MRNASRFAVNRARAPDGARSSWEVGRLNNARKRAEEVIQADWLTPPAQDQEPEHDPLDQTAARMMAIELDGDPDELARLGITLELLGWTQAQLDELQEG